MITRRLGKLLRGQATPFQLVAACVLGSLLGFAPPLAQGPALVVPLVAALLVLNANLGLALLVAGGAKLLSLLLLPLSFRVGRFLLDGPTSGLFELLVNAPVLAWAGLEYYAAAGGQLVGLVLGLVAGLALSRTVGGFRRKMAAASANPSRTTEILSRTWARALVWLFFGSAGKRSWEQKLGRKIGNPVRVWGAALLVLGLVGAWFAQSRLAGPLARGHVVQGLERVNGATVDLGGLVIDLRSARVAATDLALADPNALATDLFRAAELEADVDQADFLRRRLHVARVAVRDARSGVARETPGERTAPRPAEPAAEPAPGAPGDYSLEDVLAEAETWKGRLSQAREWLDELSGGPEAAAERAGEPAADEETLSERLLREARENGWFSVTASHLVEEAPTLRLSELVVDGLKAGFLADRVFDLRASELSTHPALVDAPPTLDLASRDGAIAFSVNLAPASRGGGDGRLRFSWKGLSVDETLARLRLPGPAPLRGGTLDLEIDGSWLEGRIGHVDLPLRATFHDTVLHAEGMQPTPLDRLTLPIRLRGPIDAPRIGFDDSTLTDALVAAGKQELASRLKATFQEQTGMELTTSLDDVKEFAGSELAEGLEGLKPGKDGKRLLGGLLDGRE